MRAEGSCRKQHTNEPHQTATRPVGRNKCSGNKDPRISRSQRQKRPQRNIEVLSHTSWNLLVPQKFREADIPRKLL